MSDYSDKIITVDQALDMVSSGMRITAAMAASQPQAFFSRLHTIADRVEDVTVTCCLPTIEFEFMRERYLRKSFILHSLFHSPLLRRLSPGSRVSYVPNCLHYAGRKRNDAVQTDIFIASASMPSPDGYVYISSSNEYETVICEKARKIIFECSPNIPSVRGDSRVPLEKVDHIIICDYRLPELPDARLNDKDMKIGALISDLIHDGDTIQVGIGGIPNAVCESIMNKKDLGAHTEMMTTGIMRLMKAGAVNGSRKNIEPGKVVFAFAFGTRELYDFMDGNDSLLMRSGAWVNDPMVVGLNDNMVSINTTVEIDLTGQCCSESVGPRQISGTGGACDMAAGAQRSKNGRSIVALYSTVMAAGTRGGQAREQSKIVQSLKPGAAVSIQRNDVDWVVTEYGAVNLRGQDICTRAKRLISIAHPMFREELTAAAREFGYIY
ncbi:MAG: 4-hydroxybutyrate--acetyl-CoA CoA transferase [Oscillospiraceae bacterium]|jgi:acyl-CoA hydrolase|nr:4-hydroxybutyrate--acetyl-CoA CoA transferase [Oscillospiraceae bacterium]